MDGNTPTNQTKHNLKFHSFESLLSNDGKVEESVLKAVSSDDPAMIMFTSVGIIEQELILHEKSLSNNKIRIYLGAQG